MHSSQRTRRRSIAFVLLASAALFAVGSQIERSKEGRSESVAKSAGARSALPAESTAQRASEAGAETGAAARPGANTVRRETHGEASGGRETHAGTGTRTSEAAHGVAAEPSAGATAPQLTSAQRGGAAKASETGSQETASERARETHREAKLLGINPEALSLVIIAVIASALLALAIWFRELAVVLGAIAGFGLLFAALDVREVLHQVDESRTGLITIASVLIGLHLLVAILAGASLLLARMRLRPASR